MYMAPPAEASLPFKVQFVRVVVASLTSSAPPPIIARLPDRVELVMRIVPPTASSAPPKDVNWPVVVLSDKVELSIVSVLLLLAMAPPPAAAELPERVEAVTASLAPVMLLIAPPPTAESVVQLPDNVEPVTVT